MAKNQIQIAQNFYKMSATARVRLFKLLQCTLIMLMQMMNIFTIKPAEDAMEVCVLYNSCALNDTFSDDEGGRTQRIRPSLPAKTSSRDQVAGQLRAGAANNIRIVHITDIHVEESYLEVYTLTSIQQN